LSVGAAPMVALATGAAPASGDVSLQADDDSTVKRATVDYWVEPVEEYTYTGLGLGPVPKTINPVNEDSEDVISLLPSKGDREEGGYYFYYVDLDAEAGEYTGNFGAPGDVTYVNAKGDSVDLTGYQVRDTDGNLVMPVKASSYAVVVCQVLNGNLVYVSTADTFDIVGQPLDAATLCDGLDATDTEFNYTGENGSTAANAVLDRINVALDGRILSKDDVELSLWDKGGKTEITGEIAIGETYIVKVEGKSAAYAGQEVKKEFTLGKLNLSDAVIVGTVITTPSTNRPGNDTSYEDAIESINGVSDLNWNGMNPRGDNNKRDKLTFTFESNPDGDPTSEENTKGEYTFTLKATDANPNVEGECTVKVMYADYRAYVDFGNAGLDQEDGAYIVDLSADKVANFDLDDIAVNYYGSNDTVAGKKVNVPAEGYDVTITDADGNDADMTKPGTYFVRVDVNYDAKMSDGDYKLVAGSDVAKVVVRYNVVEATDVFFSYNQENYSSSEIAYGDYDGTDHSDKVSVKVMVKNGAVLTEGEDYTVSFQKIQYDGKVVDVDQIVDAGPYKIVVKGITFADSYEFSLYVRPISITTANVKVDAPYTVNVNKTDYAAYGYTGNAIEAKFGYWDGEKVVALDPSVYDVQYVRDVDGDDKGERGELKDEGRYMAHLTTAEGVENFRVDADAIIYVTKTGVFTDVPNNEWYSEAVYQANEQGYIGGIGGTTLFAPMGDITRADVACVLYRMAGGKINASEEGMTNEDFTWISSFSDVDPNAYYAKAVAWCTKVGIVNGYGDTFGSARAISTEEFATMLARYAKVTGTDTSVEDVDAVLAGVADGDQVSGYAREAVAWAVENEFLAKDGNLIDPQGTIYRARAVKIAVDFQPEQLDGSILAPKPGL
uniref:S-layer homology domain-containing protein n=1 Tax=Thermophilibacter mediterraneus TaxID=1871031 RepID=UPI0023529523